MSRFAIVAAIALASLCARCSRSSGAAGSADAGVASRADVGAIAADTPDGAAQAPDDESSPAELAATGPASSASRKEREEAVAALLAGRLALHDAPTVATNPGREFDPSLRERLALPPAQRAASDARANARVKLGELHADGIDAGGVRSLLARAVAGVHACYAKGLEDNPKLQGRLAVRLVVDAEGNVTSATDDGSDVPDARVVQCALIRHRRLAFPKPDRTPARVAAVYALEPGR